MTTAVRLLRVGKTFGALEAVKELSLEIEEGEFLTLLGPSGCGKTTTLRLISGFEVPDTGVVYIGDTAVNHVPPYRRNVNTVFQNYALFPHMTVFENVAYSLVLKRAPRQTIETRVHDMLDRVGLIDKAQSMPRQLSGGQMQRIALARALINEPRVLLLDEPLGALDAKLRKSMQLELKHVHESLGITFVYVTHDQEEALVMSDRIAVMNAGGIEQLGTPDEIFERPVSQFVAEFVGTSNFLSGVVVEGQGRARSSAFGDGVIWRSQIPDTVPIGSNVTVAARPQRIKICKDMADPRVGANATSAILREVIYVGAWIRLIVEMIGGRKLMIEDLPENLNVDYRSLRPGQAVVVSVPADALLHFTGR